MEEVVGHWAWDDLVETDGWYEQAVLPAFKMHNDRYLVSDKALDMSALWSALPDTQAPSIKAFPDSQKPFYRDFDTSSESEEYEVRFEEGSESYDEAEEDNATDEALNLFEDD